MHTVVPPFVHVKIFTAPKCWLSIVETIRILIETISFRWKQAFFQLKNKFLNFWIFCQNQRGDHMHCILWCPLWSMSKFSLIKMLVVDGRNHPILIETISFHEKRAFFFQLKNKFLKFWSGGQNQRGDHMHCILWCPLWSMSKFSLTKMLVVDCWNHPILIETISFRENRAFLQLR